MSGRAQTHSHVHPERGPFQPFTASTPTCLAAGANSNQAARRIKTTKPVASQLGGICENTALPNVFFFTFSIRKRKREGGRTATYKWLQWGREESENIRNRLTGLSGLQAFQPTCGPLEHRLKDHAGRSGARWVDSFITPKVSQIKRK